MDRRNFFKIISTVSAGAATVACEKNKTDALIPLLVPDHQIVPGDEQWHPSICTSCGAGCGVIVRVMRGERIVERQGQKFREPIACVKKIEGNPLDSVSGGRLCARGHAVLQSLYHPDRVGGPLARSGARGAGTFKPVSWEDGIAAAAEALRKARATNPTEILFLTSASPGTRSLSIQHFLESVAAPPALNCSITSLAVERKAASLVFGWQGLPRYDLAAARYALSVGADFLGGWASPVYYARQFGQFRQGRPGLRGKLVQAESRMSLTAASADEWLPLHPGSEPQFLIAIARLLIDEKFARDAHLGLPFVPAAITTANLDELIRETGIPEKRVRRIARELGESEAPLVIAGASVIHTNSLDAQLAALYVNKLLGNIGRAGGVLPPVASAGDVSEVNLPEALKHAQLLFLDGENPAYVFPQASGIIGALEKVGSVVSFSGLIDDSAAYADFILPDHHSLESEAALVPAVAGTSVALQAAATFVRPLHDTRPLEQTLAEIARKVNVTFVPVTVESFIQPALKEGDTPKGVLRQGGLWRDEAPATVNPIPLTHELASKTAVFSGAPQQYPFEFQPYPSLQYHDGRDATLPWMQELPDPASSAMWGLPVEIDSRTAANLNVNTGDWVRVESAHGKIETWAYVHPAALPGVVSMAIGDGHRNYGRYASARGANPLAILAPVFEQATNSLAFGGTRVQLTRLEKAPAEFIQFSPNDREEGPWGYR